MLASTPVRVVIVVAAIVAVVAGYRWWNDPEPHIHRLLADVASTLSHDGEDLGALAVAALQNHLAPDISIEMGGGAPPLRGRQDVIAVAVRLRASTPMMRVQFFDPEIALVDESSGTTRVTVQVTTRDAGGEEVAAAHDVTIALVRAEGRWQIVSARVLPQQDAL